MASFLENKELVAMTIILLLLSILCRVITGIFLNSLIREAENMSTTQNRLLKQCKVKFRNCYKLNDGVPNIPVFVDKFMGKIQIGRISVDGLAHLSGQLMLLAVLSAGLGACAAIIDGKTVGEILPFYLMSFLGLYLYFSISGLVDLEGKKELLKISLTDFLENHMAPRLAILEESEMLAGGKPDRRNPGSRAAENTKTEVKNLRIRKLWRRLLSQRNRKRGRLRERCRPWQKERALPKSAWRSRFFQDAGEGAGGAAEGIFCIKS